MVGRLASSRITYSLRRERVPMLLAALLLLIITAFLLVPVMKTISSGFFSDGVPSSYWFIRVITNPILMAELGNTLLLAVVSTTVCLVLSLPLAVIRTKYDFRGIGILSTLVLVPLILPPFVGAIAMKRFMGQFGVFNLMLEKIGLVDMTQSLPPDWLGSGFIGVVILQSLHLFPILLTMLQANIGLLLYHLLLIYYAIKIPIFCLLLTYTIFMK